ncbi:hypothetical protein DERP_002211 [Dermatophagoides pteronyssinus]|uniref:Uncharacterized protein n=1 Tax=Dermatophagoides pteronyssinus TaxID=6956 RepID=A0ABQ8JH29_DERPT|nr:hypothetical protein DERP_002211 [Dermatophagoides pteronyssinus]
MKRKNKNKPVIQINTSFVQPDCHGHEKLNDPTIQRINNGFLSNTDKAYFKKIYFFSGQDQLFYYHEQQ